MPTNLILKKPARVIKTWKVESRTNPEKHYFVKLFENGKINCSCPAYKKCWHIQIDEIKNALLHATR